MEKAVREFFRMERKRLGLNQTQLAKRCGLTQGMISRFEVEPAYDPTVSVFKKALEGLGFTLSSFDARIEGLPEGHAAEERRPQRTAEDVADEGLPKIVASDKIEETVIRTLSRLLGRAEARAIAAHHRQAASPRPQAAERSRDHRKRPGRPARKRRLGPK